MSARMTVLVIAAAALVACSGDDTKTKDQYCAEMPAVVCGRLFDEGCALIPTTAARRYPSQAGCEAAEKAACAARGTDARLTFDGVAAASCITDLTDADCAKAARMDVHSCDKVFTEGDAGVGVIRALDAGADGGTEEDGGDR